MSLFEIEIQNDFKILNTNVFLNKKELEKFYKLNNLNDGYKDDISCYLLEDLLLKTNHNLFVMSNYTYAIEEISTIVKTNLYVSNKDSNEAIVYPEWILFFIAIVKEYVPFICEKEFRVYLKYFKYIAEIRYKKYVIHNLNNFIHHKYYKESENIRETLYSEFFEYMNEAKFQTEELSDFLNFIYSFHYKLKGNEKYKLMWNLETYIIDTVKLLLDNGVSMTDIYSKTHEGMRGTYSVLHDVHKYKPLYIEESKNYFQSHLLKINSVFKINITLEELMRILNTKEKYNDILFSYIELVKRFNANKMSEDVMGSMIKGVVLGIEEHLKDTTEKKDLYGCIRSFKKDSHEFNGLKKQIHKDDSNELFLCKLEKLIITEEESLEKYLMIYYHARNYLAHNNIDMNKFFWGENGKQIIISNVIDSVIIILYKIETMPNERTTNE